MTTLPLLTPDAGRTRRTIARCHDRLARRRKRQDAIRRTNARYLAIERAVIGGLCVVYISGVLFAALQVLSGG